MNGAVGILNVGAGDTKLSFDPNNPVERIRAARIVRDMLRRGYALLVEVERDGKKQFERAIDFREDTCEYVIADFDPTPELRIELKDGNHDQSRQTEPRPAEESTAPAPAKRRGRPPKRIDAGSTRAVSVAPIAGG